MSGATNTGGQSPRRYYDKIHNISEINNEKIQTITNHGRAKMSNNFNINHTLAGDISMNNKMNNKMNINSLNYNNQNNSREGVEQRSDVSNNSNFNLGSASVDSRLYSDDEGGKR